MNHPVAFVIFTTLLEIALILATGGLWLILNIMEWLDTGRFFVLPQLGNGSQYRYYNFNE